MPHRRSTVLSEADPNIPLIERIPEFVDVETGRFRDPPFRQDGSEFVGIHADGLYGQGQLVAIIDTGIDDTIAALRAAIVESRDFTDEKNPQDQHGHGTFVALLVLHIAPAARIVNLKALDSSGHGSEETLAAALTWAKYRNASVVNVSAGIESPDPVMMLPTFLQLFFRRLPKSLAHEAG
jgi:subtilisin family serine protease